MKLWWQLPWWMCMTLVGCSAEPAKPRDGSAAGTRASSTSAGTVEPAPAGSASGGSGGASAPFDPLLPMPDAAAATGGSTAGANALEDKCGEHRFDLERKPAELLLVLDRSASMKDEPDGASDSTPKWDLVVPAITGAIGATDSAISWGLKVFPEGDGDECVATSVTERIDIDPSPMNAARMVAAIDTTTPEGNGTPTGDAIAQGLKYLQSRKNDNPKYMLLATDGEPSCPKPGDSARPHAVQSVATAAGAGVHTFVLGVATTKKSATSILNDLAIAGMEPRDEDPNPLASRYYLANTKDQLVTALQLITGQISGCTFNWDRPPPVPDNIAVKVGGVKAPHDAQDGWEYTSGDHLGIEVRGSWCQKIKTTASNRVEITFGCPNVEIL